MAISVAEGGHEAVGDQLRSMSPEELVATTAGALSLAVYLADRFAALADRPGGAGALLMDLQPMFEGLDVDPEGPTRETP